MGFFLWAGVALFRGEVHILYPPSDPLLQFSPSTDFQWDMGCPWGCWDLRSLWEGKAMDIQTGDSLQSKLEPVCGSCSRPKHPSIVF